MDSRAETNILCLVSENAFDELRSIIDKFVDGKREENLTFLSASKKILGKKRGTDQTNYASLNNRQVREIL